MTRRKALMDLRDKVATGKLTRTSAEELAAAIFGLNQVALDFGSAYAQGSLDAALAVHSAVLPGWGREVDAIVPEMGVEVKLYPPFDVFCDDLPSPIVADHKVEARAWLLAILSALIAECDE